MRVLRCAEAINREIESNTDRSIGQLLARHAQFMSEYEGDDEALTVLMIEPADTLAVIDEKMDHGFLTNAYSGKRFAIRTLCPASKPGRSTPRSTRCPS
jgi:hypothetical protein